MLGANQHGHIESIGFDLYCQMYGARRLEVEGGRSGTRASHHASARLDVRIP